MTDIDLSRQQRASAILNKPFLSRTGLHERMFSRLFNGLVYAQIWEDPVVDMAALDLGESDDIVCIASGGCNLMSYLSVGPASISAVDLSPAHVALNRLKLAAIRTLPDYDSFFRFIGRGDQPGNARLFDRYVAPALDERTLCYWTAPSGLGGRRIDIFERGLYRRGALGRFITVMHAIARLGGIDFAQFLQSRDLAEQRIFFENEVAPLFDRRSIQLIARCRASLFGLGIPPAQFEKLAADGSGDIVPVLKERMRKLMCDFPVQDNYFAWAAFNRGYKCDGTGPLPPYLQRENFDAIRAAAPRASVTNCSVTDALAQTPTGSRSAYVLLDAQDWMTDAQLTALWAGIERTARPGAGVIFRTGGNRDILPGRVPGELLGRWRPDPERADDLWRQDRSAIYGGFHIYRRIAT